MNGYRDRNGFYYKNIFYRLLGIASPSLNMAHGSMPCGETAKTNEHNKNDIKNSKQNGRSLRYVLRRKHDC